MKPIVFYDFTKDEKGNFVITREGLDALIEKTYEAGFKDGELASNQKDKITVGGTTIPTYPATRTGNDGIVSPIIYGPPESDDFVAWTESLQSTATVESEDSFDKAIRTSVFPCDEV